MRKNDGVAKNLFCKNWNKFRKFTYYKSVLRGLNAQHCCYVRRECYCISWAFFNGEKSLLSKCTCIKKHPKCTVYTPIDQPCVLLELFSHSLFSSLFIPSYDGSLAAAFYYSAEFSPCIFIYITLCVHTSRFIARGMHLDVMSIACDCEHHSQSLADP